MAIPYPKFDPNLIEFGPFTVGSLKLGPFAIRWYALAYIAGLLVGWWYMIRLLNTPRIWPETTKDKKGHSGPDLPATKLDIDDLLVWITLGVIIGGRLGYVIFYQPHILLSRPLQIFAVWQGGMSFHGGFIGVVIAGLLFCRRRKLDPLRVGDLLANAVPIGLFFGRIANFINGELWGRVSDAPWAMVFCNDVIKDMNEGFCPAGLLPRHPSQLYEATLEGIVLFILIRVATHRFLSMNRPGLNVGLFIAGYGVARTLVEFVRQPDEQIGYLLGNWFTMGMVLSLPMVILGVAMIWRTSDKAPLWLKNGPASTFQGRGR